MTLLGKGYYIWQVRNCERGDPQAIAAKAKAAGLSHVLVKIADGIYAYNIDQKTKIDLLPPVIAACRQVGIEVWGWHYVRGDNPLGEARIAVQRSRALGVDGYVIDAEAEYQTVRKTAAASRFMKELRAGLPDLPVALSTYRFPKRHMQLPFAAFLDGCNYAMPQVYYEQAHNPTQQLEICVDQYMSLTPARPVIPTAPAYARGSWRPSPGELTAFFAKAKAMGLSAANLWSWDIASRPAYSDLWNAIAAFDWPTKPPIADMPERLFGRISERDHNLIAGLYHENAAHVTGERMIFSREEIAQWYLHLVGVMLPEAEFRLTGKTGTGTSRHFTWTAASSNGQVLDGLDTLGMRDGRIHFHFTHFTIT